MLSAETITKSYRSPTGRVIALDAVSLELAANARLGLVGPSGSGKSTLGQVIAMLLAPDRGSVTIDGDRVPDWGLRAPRDLRHRVQLLWQSPRMAVDPRLRLGPAIVEPLAASGVLPKGAKASAPLIASWGQRVGLTEDLLERFPHEVSEGQLQRACLARALILQPRYLICDELTSMLDVSTQAAVLEVVADVQAERELGVLLITHDRILASNWCHDTIELGDLAHVEPSSKEPARPQAHAGRG
jgi:peptide/nickel transport system ATP-binding protein